MKTNILNFRSLEWMFALVMMTTFFSCEKDPFKQCRQDPSCEYFTCKVNGVKWEPQCNSDPLFGCTPWDVQYYKNTSGNLSMSVRNEISKQNFKFLTREFKLIIGQNKFYKDEFIQTFYGDGNYSEGCKIFIIDTLLASSLFITKIDTINKYLAGTFSFSGKNDCGEEVQITDGEFNLPYRF